MRKIARKTKMLTSILLMLMLLFTLSASVSAGNTPWRFAYPEELDKFLSKDMDIYFGKTQNGDKQKWIYSGQQEFTINGINFKTAVLRQNPTQMGESVYFSSSNNPDYASSDLRAYFQALLKNTSRFTTAEANNVVKVPIEYRYYDRSRDKMVTKKLDSEQLYALDFEEIPGSIVINQIGVGCNATSDPMLISREKAAGGSCGYFYVRSGVMYGNECRIPCITQLTYDYIQASKLNEHKLSTICGLNLDIRDAVFASSLIIENGKIRNDSVQYGMEMKYYTRNIDSTVAVKSNAITYTKGSKEPADVYLCIMGSDAQYGDWGYIKKVEGTGTVTLDDIKNNATVSLKSYPDLADCKAWLEYEVNHIVYAKEFKLSHVHYFEETKGQKATCTTPGCSTYYTCKICKKRYYDSAGIRAVASDADIITNPTGHSVYPTATPEVAATLISNGEKEYNTCRICGAKVGGGVIPRITQLTLYKGVDKTYTLPAGKWSFVKRTSAATLKGNILKIKKAGTFKIKDSKTQSVVTVKVLSPKLTVSPTKKTVSVGRSFKLSVKTIPAATPKITVSKKSVISIDKDGVVVAIRKGSVVITIKANGLTKKVKVSVK